MSVRFSSGRNAIVPPARSRYLAAIADTVRGYPRRVEKHVIIARERQQLTEAKRLVDFAAGLVYALHGSIERVTTTVFLLTPSYVEVVDNSVAGDTQEAAHTHFGVSILQFVVPFVERTCTCKNVCF